MINSNAKNPPCPWGAVPLGHDRWSFATWAPDAREITLQVENHEVETQRQDDGTFRAEFTAKAGAAYRMVVDGKELVDPAARWIDDVTGPARLLDLPERTAPNPTRSWAEAVILEIHIGTFTTEGTFAAAAKRMAGLAALGITAIEIMPVNGFSGERGWGYDGVFPYAVHPTYGSPADLAQLVDEIHRVGMTAILDVVYNHFGPEGGTLPHLAPTFFDKDRTTPWGPGIDYSNPMVRDFFVGNAVMWAKDFGFDGFRLDAVHHVVDPGLVHLLDEMALILRTVVDRPIHMIAEDERNLPDGRDSGEMTANWNDDYHHAIHCLLTGEDEAYYAAFAVDPMGDLVRALTEGHVEQGQAREGRDPPRGGPSAHLPPTAFVNANQTHDQIGNRAQGERLITLMEQRGQLDVMWIAHAMLLTGPAIPMLVMGEEEGARAPFQFFADFKGELGAAVRKGRAAEFAAFSQFGGDVPDPLSVETFHASRPYANPAPDAADWRALTQRCLTFRADHVVRLLSSGLSGRPQVRATGARSLHGVWTFDAGTLEMVAHLGAMPDTPVALTNADLSIATVSDPCHFAIKAHRK